MKKIKIENINNININFDLCEKLFQNEKNEISLKAWTLLSEVLKKENINLTDEEIVFNEYQKPYLLSKKVYFNISHSKSAIAIIISDSECGIDIEYLDYNKKLKCINRILNSKEQEEYNNSDDKVLYFYKQWTIKEAYFKYLGTGIKLKDIQLDIENKNIKTEEITLNNEKYVVSYL